MDFSSLQVHDIEREVREAGASWELLMVTTYPGVPVLVMAVSYTLIFLHMRSSRLRVQVDINLPVRHSFHLRSPSLFILSSFPLFHIL